MTDAQRRYVRTEMIVATIINAILSIVFMLIVFGGQPIVAVGGRGGLIVDSIPQTAMIALMSMLVPSLLTRRRLKTGRIAPLPEPSRWPRTVLVRSVLVATVAAAIAWVLHALLMPLVGPLWPFLPALLFKAVYGAILGAAISGYAVTAALRE
jgi:hypothetical protein